MLISYLYFKVKQPMLTCHFVSDVQEHTKKEKEIYYSPNFFDITCNLLI